MEKTIRLERLRKRITPNGVIPKGLQKQNYDKRYLQFVFIGVATELELATATELGRELDLNRTLVIYYRKLHFDRMKNDNEYRNYIENLKENV